MAGDDARAEGQRFDSLGGNCAPAVDSAHGRRRAPPALAWRAAAEPARARARGAAPRRATSSFIETGRSQPSRAMVLRLARVLDVPIRERNQLLLAAGYAPLYPETGLAGRRRRTVARRRSTGCWPRRSRTRPSCMDRYWNHPGRNNAAAARSSRGCSAIAPARTGRQRDPPVLRPRRPAAARRQLGRGRRGARAARAPRGRRRACRTRSTPALLEEALAFPGVPPAWRVPDFGRPLLPVVPVRFRRDGQTFSYFSAVTTLGTPQDAMLQEIRVECLLSRRRETLARHPALDLVDLLEGRAVDPVDQRLRGAADGAEVDRVEAPLVGVRALRVAAVELGWPAPSSAAAASAAARAGSASATPCRSSCASSGPRTLRPSTRPQVLARVAVPAVLVGRAEVLAAVVGLVVEVDGRREPLERAAAEHRLELRAHQPRPPGVHDPDRRRVVVRAVAVGVLAQAAGAPPRAQLGDGARAGSRRAAGRRSSARAAARRAPAGRSSRPAP